jgi:hypothetical protein
VSLRHPSDPAADDSCSRPDAKRRGADQAPKGFTLDRGGYRPIWSARVARPNSFIALMMRHVYWLRGRCQQTHARGVGVTCDCQRGVTISLANAERHVRRIKTKYMRRFSQTNAKSPYFLGFASALWLTVERRASIQNARFGDWHVPCFLLEPHKANGGRNGGMAPTPRRSNLVSVDRIFFLPLSHRRILQWPSSSPPSRSS